MRRLAAIGLVLLVTGCSADRADPADAGDGQGTGFDLQLVPADGGSAPCRVERIASNDQDALPLYMVRGEGLYRATNGIERSIPVQIQFAGSQGVVEERITTLTGLDADCASVTIALRIDHCTGVDRKDVDCPDVRVRGQDAFAGVLLGRGD